MRFQFSKDQCRDRATIFGPDLDDRYCWSCFPMAVTFAGSGVMLRILQQGTHQLREFRFRKVVLWNYFFARRIASFAGLKTLNLITVLAEILIFCCFFGLIPVRASQIQARRITVLFGGFVGDGVERVPALFGPRRAVFSGPSFRLCSLSRFPQRELLCPLTQRPAGTGSSRRARGGVFGQRL